MSNRFDNRSKNTFKKDIYFSTMMEKYFFDKWREAVHATSDMVIDDWKDNGCGNDGEFIAKGNTAGADYKISATFKDEGEEIQVGSYRWKVYLERGRPQSVCKRGC